MFEIAESGVIIGGAVIIYTTSRFSREDALFHVEDVAKLKRLNVHVLSYKQPHLDPATAHYAFFLAFEAIKSAAEAEALSVDTKAGLKRAQIAGVWVGRAPFGLRKRGLVKTGAARTADGAGLEKDPDTWPDLVQLFAHRADGWSLRRIGRLVGRHETALLDIFANQTYKPYLALEDPELWDRAQLGKGRLYSTVGAQRRSYIYRGMLRCPHCGRMLVGHMVRHSRRSTVAEYYVCKASHDETAHPHPWRQLNVKLVEEAVMDLLEQADIIGPLVDLISERLKPTTTDTAEMASRRRQELDVQRQRVLHQNQRGYLSNLELDAEMAKIFDELNALPSSEPPADAVAPTAEAIGRLHDLVGTTDRLHLEEVQAVNALMRQILTLSVDADRVVTAAYRPPVARIVDAAHEVLERGLTRFPEMRGRPS